MENRDLKRAKAALSGVGPGMEVAELRLNGPPVAAAFTSRRPKIALYSHDTVGLGHFRRNLLIAQTLASPPVQADVLMIAGVHEARCFTMPRGVDCITLPALEKGTDGTYRSRRLRTSLEKLISLRAATIRAALEEFAPEALIVDSVPRGAARELDPALQLLRSAVGTRCVLGLRDIADHPDAVRKEWALASNDQAIRDHYDRIWVYGDPSVYDRVSADQLSAEAALKSRYTGYLDQSKRLSTTNGRVACQVATMTRDRKRPLVLCLLGGGADGQRLAEAFAAAALPAGSMGLILTGPFLPPDVRQHLTALARARSDLLVIDFLAEPAALLRRADRVISMGGYNTVCELLSFNKRALVVPRVKPRCEQLIRAERLRDLGLIDVVHPNDLSPGRISAWLAQDEATFSDGKGRVDLNGLTCLPGLLAELLLPGSTYRGAPGISPAQPSSLGLG